MDSYAINYSKSQFETTKNCLLSCDISLDLNAQENIEYMRVMNEDGDNLCPAKSGKFWHFLKSYEAISSAN